MNRRSLHQLSLTNPWNEFWHCVSLPWVPCRLVLQGLRNSGYSSRSIAEARSLLRLLAVAALRQKPVEVALFESKPIKPSSSRTSSWSQTTLNLSISIVISLFRKLTFEFRRPGKNSRQKPSADETDEKIIQNSPNGLSLGHFAFNRHWGFFDSSSVRFKLGRKPRFHLESKIYCSLEAFDLHCKVSDRPSALTSTQDNVASQNFLIWGRCSEGASWVGSLDGQVIRNAEFLNRKPGRINDSILS